MKRILHVEVSSLEESLRQFGEALEKTMAGAKLEPFEGIWFESMVELTGHVHIRCWELIQRLRQESPMILYALAKVLGRDYKNVRLDVKTLEGWGIIERDEARRILIPWDEIDLKVPLAAWSPLTRAHWFPRTHGDNPGAHLVVVRSPRLDH